MCLGVPGEVIEAPDTDTGMATVDVGGQPRAVNCLMLTEAGTDVAVGQWVLIHMGLALETIEESEAREILAYLSDPGGPASVSDADGGTRA